MKALVVYYSRSGATRKVAEELARRLGADVEELRSRKSYSGILGYMTAGRAAMKGKPAELHPIQRDPAGYDLVVVGTPMWAYKMSTPVLAFLMENGKQLKEVAFFCTRGGSEVGEMFAEMAALSKAPVATLGLLTKEAKAGACTGELERFAKAIVKN